MAGCNDGCYFYCRLHRTFYPLLYREAYARLWDVPAVCNPVKYAVVLGNRRRCNYAIEKCLKSHFKFTVENAL